MKMVMKMTKIGFLMAMKAAKIAQEFACTKLHLGLGAKQVTEELIQTLSSAKVQEFIKAHEHEDVGKLVLKHKLILDIPGAVVAQQIAARKKAKHKLPTWYNQIGIVYPPLISMEQASSETTARYKQKMMVAAHVADLTGGFGVDTFYMSQVCKKVIYVEPDESLSRIAEHNLGLLGAKNIQYHNCSAQEFLQRNKERLDLVYIDPSRRKQSMKVIGLGRSEPDVVALKNSIFKQSLRALIKASPMLDLRHSYRELIQVSGLTILAVENECRELIISLEESISSEPEIRAVNLRKDDEEVFQFSWENERKAKVSFSNPLRYIYEPNAAILKAGAFKLAAERFGAYKLAPDTHLYTSNEMLVTFSGRIFEVIETVRLDKNLKDKFEGGYANILQRNYPMTVAEIKKKTGLKEGGDLFLICAKAKTPIAIMAERLR